jgi:hypothetical protein
LHLNDFVTIHEQDHEESYAVIRGIFQHKGNNKKYYVFVVVDWFENTEREHPLLLSSNKKSMETHFSN